jgi:predicted nucleotidyltransferase
MALSFSAVGSPQAPVTGRDEVLQRLRQHYPQLAAEFPLASLELFGSFARDEQTPDSDVDLIVGFSAPVGFAFLHLADRLEELLGRRVDLVAADGIKSNRRPFILRSCLHVAP